MKLCLQKRKGRLTRIVHFFSDWNCFAKFHISFVKSVLTRVCLTKTLPQIIRLLWISKVQVRSQLIMICIFWWRRTSARLKYVSLLIFKPLNFVNIRNLLFFNHQKALFMCYVHQLSWHINLEFLNFGRILCSMHTLYQFHLGSYLLLTLSHMYDCRFNVIAQLRNFESTVTRIWILPLILVFVRIQINAVYFALICLPFYFKNCKSARVVPRWFSVRIVCQQRGSQVCREEDLLDKNDIVWYLF